MSRTPKVRSVVVPMVVTVAFAALAVLAGLAGHPVVSALAAWSAGVWTRGAAQVVDDIRAHSEGED